MAFIDNEVWGWAKKDDNEEVWVVDGLVDGREVEVA